MIRSAGRLAGLSLLLLVSAGIVHAEGKPAVSRDRIAEILASGTGMSYSTAYVVHSSDERHALLRERGLESGSPSRVIKGRKAYDVVWGTDHQMGEDHEIWFDVSSFARD